MNDMIGWMKEKNRASPAAHFYGAIFWPAKPRREIFKIEPVCHENLNPRQYFFHSLPLRENDSCQYDVKGQFAPHFIQRDQQGIIAKHFTRRKVLFQRWRFRYSRSVLTPSYYSTPSSWIVLPEMEGKITIFIGSCNSFNRLTDHDTSRYFAYCLHFCSSIRAQESTQRLAWGRCLLLLLHIRSAHLQILGFPIANAY